MGRGEGTKECRGDEPGYYQYIRLNLHEIDIFRELQISVTMRASFAHVPHVTCVLQCSIYTYAACIQPSIGGPPMLSAVSSCRSLMFLQAGRRQQARCSDSHHAASALPLPLQ